MPGFLEKLSGSSKRKSNKKNIANKKTAKKKKATSSTKKNPLLIKGKKWQEQTPKAIRIDVFQTPEDIVIKADISGVEPKDLNIELTDDTLLIEGKTETNKEIQKQDFYYQERHWGSFSRAIILPVEVKRDEIKAKIKHGLLTITLPKAEKEKTRKIKVSTIE